MQTNHEMDRVPAIRRYIVGMLVVTALAVSACAKSPEELLASAKTSIADKEHPTAIVTLKNLLQTEPDNLEARLMLARSSLAMADPLSAQKELERAAELGANDGEFLALHFRTKLILGEHAQVLELLSDDEGSAGLSAQQVNQFRGEALLGLGSSIEAEAAFREILDDDPEDAMARWGTAAAKASQGATEDALDIGRQLTVSDPEFARGWLIKGQMALRSGQLDNAVKDLTVAVAKAAAVPDRVVEIVGLASLADGQLGLRDADGAEPTIQRLASIAGPTLITRLLVARLAIAREDYIAAAGELEQILNVDESNLQATLLLASVNVAQKNYAQAETLLERILALQPQNLAARRLLAATQVEMNDPSAAAETLSPLLEDSDDPLLSVFASQALLQSGDPDKAIDLLEKSLVAQPDNNDLKARLATAYLATARFEDAETLVGSLPDDEGFQKSIILAFALAGQERLSESQQLIDDVVANNGDNSSALLLAADYYRRLGDTDQSRDLLQRAVKVAPDDTVALYAMAQLEYRDGNFAEARGYFQKVLVEDPNQVRAMTSLADIAARDGDLDRSLELLSRATELNPQAAMPQLMLAQVQLRNGDVLTAAQSAQKAAGLAPENASINAAAASVLLDTGKAREAQGLLSVAVQLEPEASAYWFELARAQSALGEQLESRKAVEEAVRLDPQSVRANGALARMELADDNQGKALAIVERLKKDAPDSLAPLVLEADLLMRIGQHAEAAAIYDRVYAERPAGRLAVNQYRASLQAGLETPQKTLETWVQQNQSDAGAAIILAQYYERNGGVPSAIRYYEQAIGADPENGVALNNLAWIYNQQGDAKAEGLARQALEQLPESPNIKDTLGWILVSTDQLTEGLQLLEEAAAAAPQSKGIQYHLAVALQKLGNPSRSIDILRAILADESNFAERAAAEALLAELEKS